MSTSGSQNFSQTRNEVILDALQEVGAYGEGMTVSSEDMAYCSNKLNKMVKAWATKGLHLFSREEGVLYLTPGTSQYRLGVTAKATKVSDEVLTKLNGALAASATSVTVDSTSGMAVADIIGVVLTDKTIHWTTIATIPTSTTLTLTSGVVSAASDDGLVYTYTTALPRILRILGARSRSGSGTDQLDMDMAIMSYQEYQQIPSKNNQSGRPTEVMVRPYSNGCDMYLWPAPSDGGVRVHFTYERVLEDMDNIDDDFDFPAEWLEALTYQLALRIARRFGNAKAIGDILPLASTMLDDLLSWDNEVTSIKLHPNISEY